MRLAMVPLALLIACGAHAQAPTPVDAPRRAPLAVPDDLEPVNVGETRVAIAPRAGASAPVAPAPPVAPRAATPAAPHAQAATPPTTPAVSARGSQPSSATVQAAPQSANSRALDSIDLGTTSITGNQELPKVLYIVPWKKSDLGDLVGRPVNTLLDEVLAPVDPEVFERHLEYYETLYGKKGQQE
jgi:hypothetical protein